MARLFLRFNRMAMTAALAAMLLAVLPGARALGQSIGEPGTWGQFQGGPGHPGTTQGGGPAPPYRESWTFRAPEGALSAAVVAEGVAVTVGERGVFGIDLATGEQRWALFRNGGPLSPPAVGEADGSPVLVFTDESESRGTSLVGVELEGRSEVWRTPLKDDSRSGVTVFGDSAFVGDDGGNVYAVDLSSGDLRWTAKTIGSVRAPPAVADGRVYAVGLDTDAGRVEVLALNESDGDVAWRFAPQAAGATASTAAAGDGRVIVAFADRFVRAFGSDGGSQRWGSLVSSIPFPFSSPAYAGQDVYVSDLSGGLYRLDAGSGKRIWGYQLNELVVRSSPAVSGESVLVGLDDGRLVAIDVASGDLVWQSPATEGRIGALAVTPDRVLAVKGGKRPGLLAFEHDPDGALVAIPSPTEPAIGELLLRFGLALLIVVAVLFPPALLAARRIGPPELPDVTEAADQDEEVEDDEP
ncbi:MAG: PQQ-binding-like beta-propeller repeat protein [Actinomycetota bacterium]